MLERDGLRQVVERARLQRGDRVFGASVRGDHGNGHVEPLLVDVLDHAQAGAVGKPHVGEAQIERFGIEKSDRFGDRLRAGRIETHARQGELEQLEEIRLVVDQQHSGLPAGFA